MKKSVPWFLGASALAFALSFSGHSSAAPFVTSVLLPYIGVMHTEAALQFEAAVEFDRAGGLSADDSVNQSAAREAIEAQLRYLFGPLQFDADFDAAFVKSAPKNDHQITGIAVRLKEGTESTLVASYRYTGTIGVNDGPSLTLPVRLPVRTEGFPALGGNKCTDRTYQSAGDYWYFWSPRRPGCTLVEGESYRTIEGRIVRSLNTQSSYPEYERLADASGVITISAFFGIEKSSGSHHPERVTNRDPSYWSARQYREARDQLVRGGYRRVARTDRTDMPYFAENFEKTTARAKIKVFMFYGETGLSDPNASYFQRFYKTAVERNSVVLYHGHSGLGGNLHLSYLGRRLGSEIMVPRNRYQMFMFDGCTSYPYYGSMYFNAKATAADPRGTKNLDILTNGVEGNFSSMARMNQVIIFAIDRWAIRGEKLTYQQILEQIRERGRNYLTGVNGDEDNPISP